jgi:hypothetical protein
MNPHVRHGGPGFAANADCLKTDRDALQTPVRRDCRELPFTRQPCRKLRFTVCRLGLAHPRQPSCQKSCAIRCLRVAHRFAEPLQGAEILERRASGDNSQLSLERARPWKTSGFLRSSTGVSARNWLVFRGGSGPHPTPGGGLPAFVFLSAHVAHGGIPQWTL